MQDVTAATGIQFVHNDGSSGRRYIVETVSCGLALFDYDGDGDQDLYLPNGAPLRGADETRVTPNTLYRNDGEWQFVDVTVAAGVGDTGFALGVAAADYDNDGDQDLYVNNHGPNVLYRNNGDGTFTDVTVDAGVSCGNKTGAGICFLDMDGDGDLDLYVANYVRFTYDSHVVHYVDGFPEYAGPRDFDSEPDTLFRNNGDGTFTDVSVESGIAAHAGSGMGMVCCDYDNDRDTDVFVLNDVAGNFLFTNDGAGRFQEVGLISGTAYNGMGDELGSMGVDCGDFDNDGLLDFVMTSYQGELPVLYRNLGKGSFDDVTVASGAGQGARPYVNWGVGLPDLDNDGQRDLYIVCGHLQDHIDRYDNSTAYRVPDIVLKNDGHGHYTELADLWLDTPPPACSGRGAAFGDLDGDGDVDAVILNSREAPTVIKNVTDERNHWLEVQLIGRTSNRDGVGSRVIVTAGDRQWTAEVHSGRGYQSHYGARLHFGLGKQERADRVEVRWLGGAVEVVEAVPVNRAIALLEASRVVVDLAP